MFSKPSVGLSYPDSSHDIIKIDDKKLYSGMVGGRQLKENELFSHNWHVYSSHLSLLRFSEIYEYNHCFK